ncbi:MAG TPA: hypothetical protein PLI09_14535 [Candidatus Hydrogenedentes bacterium]|nr:hypothetical protein [Candidatus Hydrogenedentota bacterium]
MIPLVPFAMLALSSGALPMLFLGPGDLRETGGVTIEAQVPESMSVLITPDSSRPKLWPYPVAAFPEGEKIRVWYQRVDKGEAEYSDQRTLCLGELEGKGWSLPPLFPEEPAWKGPNNVVMRRSPYPPTWGGFNVFQLVREGGEYRMLYWDQPEKGEAGAMLAKSPDGVHWEKDPRGTVFTEHNDAFTLIKKDGEYFVYQTALEDWPEKPYADNLDKKRRVITLRKSTDAIQWSPQAALLRPDAEDAPETEFYLMKVFAYGYGYAGLIMKYYGDPNRPNQHSGLLKTELVVSRDARHWERPFRPVDLGFWTYADPFMHAGKWCFVAGKDAGMYLVSYRREGLTAVVASEEGEFTTQPFAPPPKPISLNVDAQAGWLEVELRNAENAPIPGASPCRLEGVNSERAPLPPEFFQAAGSAPCLLHIKMHRAKLYAISDEVS